MSSGNSSNPGVGLRLQVASPRTPSSSSGGGGGGGGTGSTCCEGGRPLVPDPLTGSLSMDAEGWRAEFCRNLDIFFKNISERCNPMRMRSDETRFIIKRRRRRRRRKYNKQEKKTQQNDKKKKKVRSALQILFDATLSIFQSLWISIYL